MELSRRRGLLAGLVFSVLAGAGCGHTSVVSLPELDCASCSDGAVGLLKKVDGVRDVRFDMLAAELHVDHDRARVTVEALAKRLTRAGFLAVPGAGHGSYIEGKGFPPGLDVVWLTRDGSFVDVDKHRVPGKVTVFDYGAEWCSPCRKVDAEMVKILGERDDVALRKLDVVSWDTPLARTALNGIEALPYVIVYGPDGRLRDRIAGLDLKRLRAAIEGGAP